MKEGIGAMCEAFGVGFVKVGVVDRHVSSRRRVSECGCDRRGRWPVAVRMGSASVSRLESNASADKPFFEQEMPPLYKGWFSQSGILATQIQDVARSCVQRGDQKLEICFPPVPNVDEVKFGTRLNSMFAEDISVYLKMEDDLKKVKRYLIEFSNAYWAARLAEAFPDRSVWILFSDSVKKDSARFPPNVEKVCALRRFEERENLGDNDIVIIVDPGPTENWKKGNEFAGKNRVVVMLNSAFVETYDLCGPLKDFHQAYYLKRVSKGWVYRSDPQPWISYLERPDGSVEVMQTNEKRPRLGEISKVLRTESFKRYSIYNDRWSPGFGARL